MPLSPEGLARFRDRIVRDFLVDAVTITRVTGRSTDPGTLEVTDTVVTVYRGPARISAAAAKANTETPGARPRTADTYRLRVPVTADPRPGDDVTVARSATDPRLAGAEFAITAVTAASDALTRRATMDRHTTTRLR